MLLRAARRSASGSVACTDTSSEAVGSSRTQQARLRRSAPGRCRPAPAGRRRADAGAVADAPGRGRPRSAIAATRRRRVRVEPNVVPSPMAMLRTAVKAGLSASSAFWKTSWMRPPQRIAHEARRRHRADVAAGEADHALARVRQAGDELRQRRLPRAAFADDAEAARPRRALRSTPSRAWSSRPRPTGKSFFSPTTSRSAVTAAPSRRPRGALASKASGGRSTAAARQDARAALGEAARRQRAVELAAGCRRCP